ncbi:MAG: hypothetical protein R3C26_14680 [Calditrichia bacterium]
MATGRKNPLNNTLLHQGRWIFDYQGNWAPFSYYRLTPEFGLMWQVPDEQYASDVLLTGERKTTSLAGSRM